ncbi:MAG TPA: MEDS domain-containing protein, partial [Methanobacterium sp.]
MGVLRKSGIDIVGDVAWGTHFCQFYQTEEDLIDILVPYFKAGLENNEFCMWVTSRPLSVKEAVKSLQKVMPDIKRYLDKKQLEVIQYTEWYVKDGGFNSDRVLNDWVEKLNKALDRGYEGLRLTGDMF